MKSIVDRIEPEGYLKDYVSWASALTDACVEFHLGVALTCLSACIGSNVYYPDYGGERKWPNLYTLLLGPSGISRKTTCVRMGQRLVNSVDPLIIGDGIETREKFISYLKDQPNILWPIFEFSAVLGVWQRSYADGFKDFVTDVFDPMENRHRRTEKAGTVTIPKASVNILAASTPEWLKEKLTEGDLRGGLIGRFLIFPNGIKGKDPGLNPIVDKEKREALVNYLKAIYTMTQSWVDVSQVINEFNAWDKKVQKKMEVNYDPDTIGFQSRVTSHTLKLAVLIAISESPTPLKKYTLTSKQLNKAIILSNWLIERMLELAETGFVKSKVEGQMQKILSLSRGDGGVTREKALRALHVTARDFEALIRTLVVRGEIKAEELKTATKPARFYVATQQEIKEDTEF